MAPIRGLGWMPVVPGTRVAEEVPVESESKESQAPSLTTRESLSSGREHLVSNAGYEGSRKSRLKQKPVSALYAVARIRPWAARVTRVGYC